MPDLASARAHLAEFRRSWSEGDVICEAGGLTADDLDVILAAIAPVTSEPPQEVAQSGGMVAPGLGYRWS